MICNDILIWFLCSSFLFSGFFLNDQSLFLAITSEDAILNRHNTFYTAIVPYLALLHAVVELGHEKVE
jgi:hypothetical protein